MRTAFSYYGGKGMLSGRYTAPKYKTIVEPFAGAAAYSCRYYDHNIILIDINKRTYAIWKFLQSDFAMDIVDLIPTKIQRGDTVDNVLNYLGCKKEKHSSGLEWFLRSAANIGVSGINKRENTITPMSAKNWTHNTIDKINFWNKRIRHWRILNDTYTNAPDIEATWFIDPPYCNKAGKLYMHSDIDYNLLREFVLSRRGQTIVCEQEGADWLDGFKPIANTCTFGSSHISKSKPKEVAWENDDKIRQLKIW